jgi:predicted Zn-dependent protease
MNDRTKRTFRATWLLAVLSLGLTGCYTVPETGRKSVVAVSPAQETEMGKAAFAEVQAKEKVSHDQAANERVRRVGQRIANAVGGALPSAQWEFVVFDAPDTVNAFALPGGKVGVYTGLLKLAATDDELAIVMGHEIGHVTARHGGERMTQAYGMEAANVIAGVAMPDGQYHDMLLQVFGVGGNLAVMHFSREQESEADHIGIRYAAKAGYDPRAAITFWEKMAKQKGSASTIKWLSTHPPDAQRIADLQRLMPEVIPLYDAARGVKPSGAERPIGADTPIGAEKPIGL